MRKDNLRRMLAFILMAAIAFIQPISVLAEGGGVTQSEDTLTITGTSDWTTIKKPSTTEDGVFTWDCIWFGKYWQNTDSNGDGKVTQDDVKEPIKWRVLDIDDEGNALLLSVPYSAPFPSQKHSGSPGTH